MRSPLIEAACACQLSLDAAGRSGAENMAIDAALLDRANGTGLSFLRLYRFDPPCLSLGRNEPAEIGRASCRGRVVFPVVARSICNSIISTRQDMNYTR